MTNKKKNILLFLILPLFVFLVCNTGWAEIMIYEVGDESVQVNCSGDSAETSCVITDPQGRKLGYDLLIERHYREIYGTYGATGLGCIDCEDETPEPDSYELAFDLTDGVYTIEVMGVGLTQSYVGIYISTPDKDESFDIHSVIDKGLTSTFKFTYNSTDTSKWSAVRVATPSSIKQDITLSRQIESNLQEGNMINSDGVMKSLLKKVEAIEASIQKGKTKTAKNQLNAFINEVKAQSGKHIDEGAVKMLIEDAQYIMDNL